MIGGTLYTIARTVTQASAMSSRPSGLTSAKTLGGQQIAIAQTTDIDRTNGDGQPQPPVCCNTSVSGSSSTGPVLPAIETFSTPTAWARLLTYDARRYGPLFPMVGDRSAEIDATYPRISPTNPPDETRRRKVVFAPSSQPMSRSPVRSSMRTTKPRLPCLREKLTVRGVPPPVRAAPT